MRYHIYGIGNALVDIEYQVDTEFLNEHGIEKGMMTLVDEQRQLTLIEALNKHMIKKQSGGSAANTMIASSQFGANCFYSCKVASDQWGDFYTADLNAAGVDSNLSLKPRNEGLTGRCLVMITDDADRTMNTFLGITTEFSTGELVPEALKDSHWLYIEGYLVANPVSQKTMVAARELADQHSVKTALTFSDPNMVKFFRKGFDQVIGSQVDLLFCNEDEAITYTGVESLAKARDQLKQIARTFVITQGKNGAIIFDGDTYIDIEPYPVKAVDTNGAGDMFAGAFLYGITHGHSYAQAGKIASLASSRIVSQFGPRLQWHQAKEVLNYLFKNH
ncbi:MAG: adenosine kinase [Cyclobacteriaceae bacterium]|nr:MAG: adenosine kinase [Cyclobacteriaceae bacterium]